MALGDAIPGGNTDELYTGDTGDSVFSMQYYRNKAREFQQVLNQLDEGARAAQAAIDADIDEGLTADLLGMLDEFNAKKAVLRATAEAINLGAAAVNSMGGRFPQLSIPTNLGFVPLLPVAAVAAIGTAVALISWGITWLQGVNTRLRDAQLLDAVTDPVQKAALASAIQQSDAAVAAATESPLQSLASIAKWVALGAGALLVWRFLETSRRT